MIRHYLRRHARGVSLAILLSIASAALSMSVLARLSRMATPVAGDSGWSVLGAGLALVVAMAVTNIVSQTYLARLGADIITGLRRDLSQRFLALDYDKIRSNEHVVTTVLISDIQRLAPILLMFPQLLFNALTVAFCLTYLGILAAKLFALLVVLLACAMACSAFFTLKTGAIFGRLREADGKLFQHFRAVADGKKELTLSEARAHHFMNRVLAAAIEQARRVLYTAQKWAIAGETASSAIVYGALFTVIYAGHVLYGESAATIMQFIFVALFMVGPLNSAVATIREMNMGYASVRHLEAMGVAPWREPSSSTALEPVPAHDGIRAGEWETLAAQGLCYTYREGDGHGFDFGPVDMRLRRGEVVFLVGGNGSGKSTLVLLLSGLLQPSAGRIEVDGDVVTPQNLRPYRRLFTGVFSDFFLFSHVVDREGHPASDERINAWLEKLEIHRSVRAVEGELSTLNLSQGQRKRLALTQSYIDDSDIYIFDEWAADQDPLFRRFFYFDLLPELKERGKTAIVVTHDDRYFSVADRVLKLEQGRLVA